PPRSLTFISVISPVTIPAFTFIAAGVTVYVLSSITAAVAAGCGAGPRTIQPTTATSAAPSPHRHHRSAFSSPTLSVGQNLRCATIGMAAPTNATTATATIPAPGN